MVLVEALVKRYFAPGWPRRESLRLDADFAVEALRTIGLLGANGSGKTTLLELLTGSNLPSTGRVIVDGKDMHKVRYAQRDRLAIHYHQSCQVRHYLGTLAPA